MNASKKVRHSAYRVGLGELKNDGNMGFYVDGLENCSGGRSDGGGRTGVGFSTGGRIGRGVDVG
jgi:hypothetical protein